MSRKSRAVATRPRSYVPEAPDNYPAWAVGRPGQWSEYWESLRSHLGMVGLFSVVGALGGFGFAMMQHPLYRARTALDIQSLNTQVLSMNADAGGTANTGVGLPDAYLQTEIKLLQSDAILKRALTKTMAKVKEPPKDRSMAFAGGLIKVAKPENAPLSSLIADASRRVKIRALGNTRIVEILCDARDGQLAANMCNSMAEAYIENNLEARQQSTKQTAEWLGSQLDNVRKRLAQSEAEMRDLARASSLVFNTEFANPAQENLRQLQGELSRAQATRIGKQSEYEVVLGSTPDALPLQLDAGPIREYRMRLTELRRQAAEMSATMKPEHYRVRELQAQIAAVETALRKEHQDLLTRLRTDFESTERRERMLQSAFGAQTAALSAQGDKAVVFQMLKRDVDSGRRLYEVLPQKVEEVGLAAAMRTSTINIVDKAVPPVVPFSPNWLASIGVGWFGATCLGMGIGMLRSRSDHRLRHPGEAPQQLQVRELGVIPSTPSRTLRIGFRRSSRSKGGEEESAVAEPREAGLKMTMRLCGDRMETATYRGDPPHVAEAFCGTMESLLFASGARTQCQVVVVTSPEKGDGKTTVSINLAVALARTNRRVVLVDGDLRRPRLYQVFDLPTTWGLAALLNEKEQIQDVEADRVAVATEVNGLFVIPTASVADGEVSTMLHSERMRQLIRRLRRDYDVVLIDTPPMLAVSDARVLGSLSDWALLVLRAGKTTREKAAAAQDCLGDDGIPVVGTVLNDWNPRKSKSYQGYTPKPYASSSAS